MGAMSICGWIWLSFKTGASVGTEIPIAIISGLGGVLTGKHISDKNKSDKEEDGDAKP